MGGKGTDSDAESKSREELLEQIRAMEQRLAEMKHLEERCRHAEETLRALEQRSQLFRESAPMGVCAIDLLGRVTIMNRKMQEMLFESSIADGSPADPLDPQELPDSPVCEKIRRCMEEHEDIVFEQPSSRSPGGCRIVRYHSSPVSDGTGDALGAIVFGEDVTELHRMEQALRESDARYRLLFQSSPIAMLERDASALKIHIEKLRASGISNFEDYLAGNPGELGHCISMIKTVGYNAAFLELMEVSHESALNSGFGMARFDNMEEVAREIFFMIAEGGVSNEKERSFTTLNGSRRHVLAKALVVSGHESTFSRIVIALVDITARKIAEEALRASEQRSREQAMRDDLTGLFNRRFLYHSLASLVESARAEGSQVSVLFMDIDHFKEIVDTHGHLNGSRVIRELAATIRDSLHHPAYAVAYAGDEFIVVLPGFDEKIAFQKALEIRDRVKQAIYLRDQEMEVRLQTSIGVATFPDHAEDMRNLLSAADRALFYVKENGRNGVELYGRLPSNLC